MRAIHFATIYTKSISILNAMRMKNEQRYGGIIQAQMKDLGVLLPKGSGDEEGGDVVVGGKKRPI